jgi:hypothetical protein
VAQKRFEEGRRLVKQQRYDEASRKFLESLQHERSVGALLNLADCYDHLGQTASAYRAFVETERMAGAKHDARETEAHARAEALAPRLSTLTIDVSPEAARADVQVRIDGAPIDRAEWGQALSIDPGPHVVRADSAGKRALTRRVDIGDARDRQIVQIPTLAPEEEGTAPAPEPAARPDGPPPAATAPPARTPPPAKGPSATSPAATATPEADRGGAQRTIGLAAGGVGVAALAVGVTTGLIALRRTNDLKSQCAAYPTCAADHRDGVSSAYDSARGMATLSTITFVVGSALVGAGVILYLTAPPRDRATTRSARAWIGTTAPGVAGGLVW